MKNKDVQIVIIDDDLSEFHPVVIYLKRDYSNVELIRTTTKGVQYVANNLDKNLIVILDHRFTNDKNGDWALEQIRKSSSLIPVILFTAESPTEKFKKFINLKTIAFAKKGDYEDVAAKVTEAKQKMQPFIEKAEDKWETSIVGVLEDYIKIRDKDRRNRPYNITLDGKKYSLEELLTEVQNDSDLGKRFDEKVHKMTIQSLLKREVELEVILIIDDKITRTNPISVSLSQIQEPIIKKTPQEGIDYVRDNLDKIMIILLDYKLGDDEPNGSLVIKKIREYSKVIPIILMSAAPKYINEYDEFINNDTFVVTKKDVDDIKEKVLKAIEYWQKITAGAYEEWVNSKSEGEKTKPYLAIAGKRTFTLNDLLKETFQQTQIGQKVLKDLVMSTMDLLIRKKIQFND